MTTDTQAWIAVDLDGTLAHYSSMDGIAKIGDPIEPMVDRIRQWRSEGIGVRVFTARASVPELIPDVTDWLISLDLDGIAVTNIKDVNCVQLWDDRAVQVQQDTGEILTPREHIGLELNGWIGVELDGTLATHTGSINKIGEPVHPMRTRVQQWLMAGIDVRLFTARANYPALTEKVQDWLNAQQLGEMKITAEKDFQMSQFWDDRCIRVVQNTGSIVAEVTSYLPEKKFEQN